MRHLDDGATVQDHNEAAARQFEKLGKKRKAAAVAEHRGPQLPDAVAYIWFWFLEILTGLDGGGFGPPAVSWVSVKAWSELTRTELEPWEVSALMKLGTLRTSIIAEDMKTKTKAKPKK